MKARLVAQRRPMEVNQPTSPVYALDPHAPIPVGWEEIELPEPPFRGTQLVRATGEKPALGESLDLCRCGHDRRSHVQHGNHCLVRRGAVVCRCMQFKDPCGEEVA